MEIGTRLKKERKRLGLNQDAMAALAGLQRMAQVNYEKGTRIPDGAYFAAIAGAGVDVNYVITGQPAASSVTDDERAVLMQYRSASADLRRAVRSILDVPAPDATPEKSADDKRAASALSWTGDNHGQILSGNVRQDHMTFNVGTGGRQRRKPSK